MNKEINPYGEGKEGKAILECLKIMYKESEPSADITKIIKSGEGKMPDFFMAYYLPDKRMEEIINDVCREFKIYKFSKRTIEQSIWLGSSPCGNKEISKKYRKDHKKRLKDFLQRAKDDK